jgi:C-5 cytosine-specific DNA methylase
MTSRPIVIDLFCGLFGWSKGFLAEGWQAIGFDIERKGPVPDGAELVLQDVGTLHGQQFRRANAIVASPPCQEYSLWGMRMFHPTPPTPDLRLWQAAIRIANEAKLPLVVENVRGAQYFWGKPNWREGPFYLWFYGCPVFPALVPHIPKKRKNVVDDIKDGVRRGLQVNSNYSSTSVARRELTASAAEIPFDLAVWISQCLKPSPKVSDVETTEVRYAHHD